MKLVLICMSLVLALVTAQHRRCFQTASYGSCKGYRQLWAYSQFQKRCIMFDYSGCGGNDNRFYTYSECLRVCYIPTIPIPTTAETTTTKRTTIYSFYEYG
ncbi:hypothetical protein KR038_001233 [Drosophila bunnanda]|nr:hypothetical protein KR038_001233 [Drosophila bunnanda]